MNTRTVNSALQKQLDSLIPLKGFMYAIMMDSRIDFLLAQVPPQDGTDIEQLAAQASAIVKSDIETNTALGDPKATESILFTSENEVRIIYKLNAIDNHVFLMLVLRKNISNIALAMSQIRKLEPLLKL